MRREGGRPLGASRILAPAKWAPCWISIKPTQRSLLRNYSLKLVSAWNFNLFYLNFPLMPELRQIRWICGKWKSDKCDVMWAPGNNSYKGWLIHIYEFTYMNFPTTKWRPKLKRLSVSISMHGKPVQTQYISLSSCIALPNILKRIQTAWL